MLKVVQDNSAANGNEAGRAGGSLLDEIVRDGARQMLAAALQAEVAAAAMIDRIVHHAEVITLKGASYRLRHTSIDTLPSAAAEQQAD